MSNVVQVRYTIATRGLRARYNPLFRVNPSASPRVYTLTRVLWAHNPLLAIVYPYTYLLEKWFPLWGERAHS